VRVNCSRRFQDCLDETPVLRDRRSLGTAQKPSGVLVGHTEGITYVSSKGDGRYVISNGKDQALRLWDLRRMRSSGEFDEIGRNEYHIRGYDYRYVLLVFLTNGSLRESINRQGLYLKPRVLAHPKDCSVMTYRGHAVLRTLIRCYFSPAETTGGQYLYSGSQDGKIHVSFSNMTNLVNSLTADYGDHPDLVARRHDRASSR
jgi:WD repeat-containing protein 23